MPTLWRAPSSFVGYGNLAHSTLYHPDEHLEKLVLSQFLVSYQVFRSVYIAPKTNAIHSSMKVHQAC